MCEVQTPPSTVNSGFDKIGAMTRNELRGRGSRERDLANKWITQTGMNWTPKSKEDFDMNQCHAYFTLLGWMEGAGDDPISDERLNSLLRRVQCYKLAKEANKADDMNWDQFR